MPANKNKIEYIFQNNYMDGYELPKTLHLQDYCSQFVTSDKCLNEDSSKQFTLSCFIVVIIKFKDKEFLGLPSKPSLGILE